MPEAIAFEKLQPRDLEYPEVSDALEGSFAMRTTRHFLGVVAEKELPKSILHSWKRRRGAVEKLPNVLKLALTITLQLPTHQTQIRILANHKQRINW